MPRFYSAVLLAVLSLSASAVSAQEGVIFRPDVATFRYTEDQALVEARVALVDGVGTVLRTGLSLLGMKAPEEM